MSEKKVSDYTSEELESIAEKLNPNRAQRRMTAKKARKLADEELQAMHPRMWKHSRSRNAAFGRVAK